MRLHDNAKQIVVKFHTLEGKWFKYQVYLSDFNTVSLCLIMFDWVQKLNGIKHSCMHIFGVQHRTQINRITASIQFN